MPESTVPWTLAHYIDFSVLLSGSSFTVGIADEGPCNPAVPTMPESCSGMASTPESCHARASTRHGHQARATSRHGRHTRVPLHHGLSSFPMGGFFRGCYMSQAPVDLGLGPALNLPAISMVVSSLVVSSQAVSSPSPVVLEIIPPSRVLPVVATTIVCVWATYYFRGDGVH